MTRYVIGPDVAIRLARDQAVIRGGHQVLAPALLRSQVLSLLYQAVRRGEMTRKDAERQLEYVRGLRIRLLGDRVLQNVAWKAAVLLGWPDTFDAEYVALTQLHADALITLDRHLADAVKDLVTIAPIEALYGPKPALPAALPRELLIRNEGVTCAYIYTLTGILTHGLLDLVRDHQLSFSAILIGNQIAEYVLHVRGLFAVPEWYRIAGSAVGVCATGFGTGAKYP